MKFFWRFLNSSLLILILVLVSACEKIEVADNLNQSEAHEIVSVLSQSGVPAVTNKGRGSNAGHNVAVSRSDYLASIALLTQQGLPRPREKSFSELVAPQGIMPNSREVEALRIDHALARELEESVGNIADVKTVKAIVRYHFGKEKLNEPQVALVIKVKPKSQLQARQINRLVKGVFPAIPEQNIVVDLSVSADVGLQQAQRYGLKNTAEGLIAVPLVHFLFWNIPGDEHYQLAVTLLGLLAAALILGILIGYYYAFFHRFGRGRSTKDLQRSNDNSFDNFVTRNLPEK